MNRTNHSNDAESTGLGWKFVMIVGVITTIFFTFLYLAMSSEPDYMPNQEAKKGHYQLKTISQPASENQQNDEAPTQQSTPMDTHSQHQAQH